MEKTREFQGQEWELGNSEPHDASKDTESCLNPHNEETQTKDTTCLRNELDTSIMALSILNYFYWDIPVSVMIDRKYQDPSNC